MVVCLQREEEEHRLQEKHKETVELLNGPDAIRTRRSRLIGVGIQNEIQKCSRESANGHQCCNYKEEVGEGVQFLWLSESDADALSTAECSMYFECATVTLWSPMQTLEPTVL